AAAVIDGDVGARTTGSTRAVHGGVAATDHGDTLADTGLFAVVEVLEEVESALHASALAAIDPDRLAAPGAEREHHGVVLGAERVELEVAAQPDAAAEHDARVEQPLQLRVQCRAR